MAIDKPYLADFEAILSHRYDQGADYWTTPDKRLIKGSPFSMLDSVHYLLELGLEPTDPLLKACADLILSTWKEQGSFKLYPQGSIYPCHTALAANALGHLGYAADTRVQKTFQHLLAIQYTDGGWRCNKFSFGRGPETQYSNPLPTLVALDAFRFSTISTKNRRLTGLWISCLNIGESGNRLARANMGSVRCLCRWNIPFALIIYFITSMCYPFMTVPKRTRGFEKP
jgi:hypothetical protein